MTEESPDWSSFAILLIDVQKDFWTSEMDVAYPDFGDNIGKLLTIGRGAGIDVIHLRARFSRNKSDWMVRYLLADKIPCVDGTAGSKTFEFADAVDNEPIITKRTFDGFLSPDLNELLQSRNKRFLLLGGLVTSVCVLLTAAAAAQRGYLVSVVEDCCADRPEAHRHTLERYPFVFEQTSLNEIENSHSNWINQLNIISGRQGA